MTYDMATAVLRWVCYLLVFLLFCVTFMERGEGQEATRYWTSYTEFQVMIDADIPLYVYRPESLIFGDRCPVGMDCRLLEVRESGRPTLIVRWPDLERIRECLGQ